jgi:hypothetical protein
MCKRINWNEIKPTRRGWFLRDIHIGDMTLVVPRDKEKRCKSCRETKDYTEFYWKTVEAKRKMYLGSRCKSCISKEQRYKRLEASGEFDEMMRRTRRAEHTEPRQEREPEQS